MRKTLLSIIAGSLTAVASMANVHTIVFDGSENLYGLTRQTFESENALKTAVKTMEFVPELSFTQSGIDFSIKKTAETDKGYALVNAGGTNSGLCIFGLSNPALGTYSTSSHVSLTVPGGKITAAKIVMSGYAAYSLTLPINDKEIEPVADNGLYYWLWTADEGVETVAFDFDTKFGLRYLHSIELTYTEDLGGKEECGLAFSAQSAEAIIGEEFDAPVLSNPNNLPITWSSTDEKVATVSDNGTLTLVGGGKTFITAETAGNENYAAGNARYELCVVPTASNIADLLTMAPEVYDRVKVNFPLTVTFANGSYAFVIDGAGKAACIENIKNQGSTSAAAITIYKVGNIIPAGWIATNATIYSSVIWSGIPGDVKETTEVEYPVVTAVTPEDADRVVILKEVTFTTRTASDNTKAYGTTPDGTKYEFQDTYNTPQKAAGTYDVKAVVRYSKSGSTVYFYLAPLAYTVSDKSGIAEIESDSTEARYYNLNGVEVANPVNGVFVKVAGGKATKVIVK